MGTAISALIIKARRRVNETSTVFHSDDDFIAYTDEAQKYTVRKTKCLTAIDTDTTIVSGTQGYALPSDWWAIKRILFDGTKLFQTDFDEIDDRELDETDETGTPTNYYEWNDSMYLIPIPGGGDVGKTVKIYYHKQPTTVDATDDTLDTKAIYDDIIIAYMVYLALIKDSEFDMADYILSEFHRKIVEMKQDLREKLLDRPPRFRRSTNLKTSDGLADWDN